jgi:hypothetical protein
MRRIVISMVVVATAMVLVFSVPAFGVDQCVRNNDACLGTEDGTVTGTVDIGAIDAEGTVGPEGGGFTGDAGAIDVQAGTDREECADAGSINVPPDQEDCPPQ